MQTVKHKQLLTAKLLRNFNEKQRPALASNSMSRCTTGPSHAACGRSHAGFQGLLFRRPSPRLVHNGPSRAFSQGFQGFGGAVRAPVVHGHHLHVHAERCNVIQGGAQRLMKAGN